MGFLKSIGKIAKTVAKGPYKLAVDKLLGSEASNMITQAGLSYATGGVSGVVGLGQDFLQSQYNQAMQKDMAAYNAQMQQGLNDRAFQQNLQMWNLKNAYDSPAEQMKRFEAAGLNKNLIYGQSNTSGSTPELSPATYNAGQYKPVDNRIQRAQLQLALAEQHQRVTNQAIENDLARQRLFLAARDADRQDKLANAQIAALGANLGFKDREVTLNENKPRNWIEGTAQGLSWLYNKVVDKAEKFYYDDLERNGYVKDGKVFYR